MRPPAKCLRHHSAAGPRPTRRETLCPASHLPQQSKQSLLPPAEIEWERLDPPTAVVACLGAQPPGSPARAAVAEARSGAQPPPAAAVVALVAQPFLAAILEPVAQPPRDRPRSHRRPAFQPKKRFYGM